jgi:hypothetical protein
VVELLKLLTNGVVEKKDVIYLLVIGAILIIQRIKVAQQSHCPSHKYLIDGLEKLENKVTWGNDSILKIAIKNDIKLDPKP